MTPMAFVRSIPGVAALGLTDLALFGVGGMGAMVLFEADAAGVQGIQRWSVPGVPQPTADAFQAAMAAPAPPLTPAELLAYASGRQNALLGAVWTIDAGTADAPLKLTTRLDAAGIASMSALALWAILNSSASPAPTEAYSNVDFTAAALTPVQALAMSQRAGAIVSQSYAALNSASAGVLAASPTISTTAQIDALAWPTAAT